MNKQYILITYKSGATITLDVPDNYYAITYAKKNEKKVHNIFLKQYNKLVAALDKSEGVVNANKYFKWSNAKIDSNDILAIDIKTIDIDNTSIDQTSVFVPGAHDKVYLDMSETSLQQLLDKLNNTDVLENFNKLILKLLTFFNKSNVEVSIKAKPKVKATTNNGRNGRVINSNTIGVAVAEANSNIDSGIVITDITPQSSTSEQVQEENTEG